MPYKVDKDNWGKLTKQQKESFLRSALLDFRVYPNRRYWPANETIVESVSRLKAVWQKELDRRDVLKREKRVTGVDQMLEAIVEEGERKTS